MNPYIRGLSATGWVRRYVMEDVHRVGGTPGVMKYLLELGWLDGSCRTPIAGYARIADGRVSFRGMVLRIDGSEAFETEAQGDMDEGAALGSRAGRELLARLPANVLP